MHPYTGTATDRHLYTGTTTDRYLYTGTATNRPPYTGTGTDRHLYTGTATYMHLYTGPAPDRDRFSEQTTIFRTNENFRERWLVKLLKKLPLFTERIILLIEQFFLTNKTTGDRLRRKRTK